MGNAARADNVYPQFIKNLGKTARSWLKGYSHYEESLED